MLSGKAKIATEDNKIMFKLSFKALLRQIECSKLKNGSRKVSFLKKFLTPTTSSAIIDTAALTSWILNPLKFEIRCEAYKIRKRKNVCEYIRF